ncbi:MAG: DUF3320 domain-containing protein [Phycisphaerae bacterium]|nr:DUF3320 domain-containing protein [Phycisphaerae bacterium]
MPPPTIAQLLETSRRELLDLSNRNRLLNMPLESRTARLVQIVGEEVDTLYRVLVDDGKAMGFVATLPSAPGRAKTDDGSNDESDDIDDAELDAPVLPEASRSDNQLSARLTPEALEKRLLSLFRDAQSIMEEQGVNILYLALGRLTWFESNDSSVARHAPLLLLPVTLTRTARRFALRWSEEDLQHNLSLAAKLKADFGLTLPELGNDESFRPSTYIESVRQSVKGETRWTVETNGVALGFFSFAKFLMYRDLDARTWPDPQRFLQSSALGNLLGDGFAPDEAPFAEDVDLDQLIPAEKLDHVVDADGSQTLAIEAIRRGKSIVIQGPPGTGKSQTITNVIATAALDGKRVLFVAEKLAALEVVKRRLEAADLGAMCLELHSNKANKRAVVAEFDRTWRLGRPRGDDLASVAARLEQLRAKLNAHATLMHATLEPRGVTPYRILGELALLTAQGVPPSTLAIREAPRWDESTYAECRDRIADLAQKVELMGVPARHPWRGCQRTSTLAVDYPEIRAAIEALESACARLTPEAERGAAALRQSAPTDLASMRALQTMLAHVAAAPPVDREALGNVVWSAGIDGLRTLVERGCAFAAIRTTLGDRVRATAFDGDSRQTLAAVEDSGRSLFRFFSFPFRRAMKEFRALVVGEPPRDFDERVALLKEIVAGQQHAAAVRAGDALAKQAFGAAWSGLDSNWAQLAAIVAWASNASVAKVCADFRQRFAALDKAIDYASLVSALQAAVQPFADALDALSKELALDPAVAFGAPSLDRIPIATLRERIAEWRGNVEALSRWTSWHQGATDARSRGLGDLVTALETGAVPTQDAVRAFQWSYHRELLREAVRRHPELSRFDGVEHSRIVEEFRATDRERLRLAKYRALLAHYESLPPRTNLGMTGVLLGEIEKKRGHRPIRKLLKDAGSVAQSIKPVFMMSPLSVAQFLEPGAIEFDLLVIDEASQIQPVDAFGAFVRAKQYVVVGDSKQLPPTKFFERLTSNDETVEPDDEAPALAQASEMESILGLCVARGLREWMLRWHYRSRHQSLIAVSNAEFYDNRLFIIPSPVRHADGLGLRFEYVPDGIYDRGNTGTNRVEARAVCRAIVEHARAHPERSLGVAAFSIRQQQAILDELDLLEKKGEFDRAAFDAEHPFEPFFVKNLESVQGDERDVIFISVGYGRDASGYMAMNFGPLSGDGGERRLNVLISRAKRQCVVFSSIRADAIDLARVSGRGVPAFKRFLQFAETGRMDLATRSAREEGSPFEEAVRQSLEASGFTVEPQVGQSGFFIDLGIHDRETPGRFILGIECDGASYHSSRSARDRDRLRQAVLENHGWRIHRIWSTDWFQRRDEELKKALAAIERARVELAEGDRDAMEAAKAAAAARETARETAIARDVDVNDVGAAVTSEPYKEADLDVGLRTPLQEVPASHVAEIVRKVVAIEGPIHVDEVVVRIRTFWNLARSGRLIYESVVRGIDAALAERRVARDGDFLSIPGAAVRVRNRSAVGSSSLRDAEMLPPAEIAMAIVTALEASHAATEADVVTAVARALGFKSTGESLRTRITDAIRRLVGDGRVQSENGMLRLSE